MLDTETTALDDAVRATCIDPGGRRPVRERAIEAAAHLIAESGLGSLTLDVVADVAGCSLPSLHVSFGGRDGLLTAVFERYSPLPDFKRLMAARSDDFEETVRGVRRALLSAFSRPDGPVSRLLQQTASSPLASLSGCLTAAMDSGRIRRLPLPLLVQLLVAPIAFHALSRPTLARASPHESCGGYRGAGSNAELACWQLVEILASYSHSAQAADLRLCRTGFIPAHCEGAVAAFLLLTTA